MQMRIEARFNGPLDSAHGGVACGVFAGAIDSRLASVRLSAPPPLDQELRVVESEDGSFIVVGADGAVASVQSWDPPLDLAPLPRLSVPQIEAARTHWLEMAAPDHPFPTCFGCGHGRPADDGLGLYAGRVPDTDLCAAAWTPTEGEAGQPVDDWVVWAVVDCPSGAAVFDWLEPGDLMLLGELQVHIIEAPLAGTEYQIVSRPDRREGRKMFSDVALVGADGSNLARGQATWVRLQPAGTGS